MAVLASDDPLDSYGADIQHYVLATLPRRDDERSERIAALDPAQRAAVAQVLAYLADTWASKTAGDVLRDW